MTNFIERIKSYSKRKDAADMAIRAWKSDNKKVYADFCKRMDAVAVKAGREEHKTVAEVKEICLF